MSEDECSGSEEQIECGWCGRKDSQKSEKIRKT